MSNSWTHIFNELKYELIDIIQIISKSDKIYPHKSKIFSVFDKISPEDVRVVIIGSQPLPESIGIGYSVPKDEEIPNAVRKLHTWLSGSHVGFRKPKHGCFDRWMENGILPLNIAMSVCDDFHNEIYIGFIAGILRAILEINPQCVFVLMGRDAAILEDVVGEKRSFKCPDPATSWVNTCTVFKSVATFLETNELEPIDWNL